MTLGPWILLRAYLATIFVVPVALYLATKPEPKKKKVVKPEDLSRRYRR